MNDEIGKSIHDRMQRTIGILILFATFSSSVSCFKDDVIKNAISKLDIFTEELVRLVKEAPTTLEGIDSARVYFDKNKEDVSREMKNIGKLHGV